MALLCVLIFFFILFFKIKISCQHVAFCMSFITLLCETLVKQLPVRMSEAVKADKIAAFSVFGPLGRSGRTKKEKKMLKVVEI